VVNPSSSSQYGALQVVDDDVVRVIRSSPFGSAGSPDGITPQHLKYLASLSVPGVASELLKLVIVFVNLILNGETPGYINDVIFGGTLITVQKQNSGTRPSPSQLHKVPIKVPIFSIATLT